MLMALEQGVKGGVWYSLIDKVYPDRHLFHAAQRVLGNQGKPGVEHGPSTLAQQILCGLGPVFPETGLSPLPSILSEVNH